MAGVASARKPPMNVRVMAQVKEKTKREELKTFTADENEQLVKVPYRPLSSADSFAEMTCLKKTAPEIKQSIAVVESENPEVLAPELRQAMKKATNICTFRDPNADGSALYQAVFVDRKGTLVSDLVVPVGFDD